MKMAQLGFNGGFDATQVAPAGTFEVLPADDYLVQIINSAMKATKDNAGQYLELEMDILDGPYQGRKIFDRLNLINANAQTVEIANRTLSAICHATGVMSVSDSEQLHFKPIVAKVTVKPARTAANGKSYDAGNEVKGYRNPQGDFPTATRGGNNGGGKPQGTTTQQQTKPQPQAQAGSAPQASTGAAGKSPPWRRK